MLGIGMEWQTMETFLPLITGDPIMRRSAWASTFAASLQLSKDGKLAIRQDNLFGPIYLRAQENAQIDD
jgi:segregation and condensation protein A